MDNENMGNVRILLPQERLSAVDMQIDEKPFVGVLNEGLSDFGYKEVFGWYLSLIIDYERTVGDGMPDRDDTSRMQTFSDALTKGLSEEPDHPNALFLGRVTGDGYTHIMWYVNNPDTADKYLKELIDSKSYPFDFDYEMTPDPEWSEAAYWLLPFTAKSDLGS